MRVDASACMSLQLLTRAYQHYGVNAELPSPGEAREISGMTNYSLRAMGLALASVQLFALGALPVRAGSLLLYPLNFVVGQQQSLANDINDSGQVAAQYRDASGNYHAVIWKNGAVTNINIGYTAFATRINAQGTTIGPYVQTCCKGSWNAFVYDPVTQLTRTISEHAGYGTFPNGINSSGVIVGDNEGKGSSPILKGWEDNNTLTKSVNVKNALSTNPTTINAAGTIGGWYFDAASVRHGFTRAGTKTTIIDPPGATITFLANIADDGTVVGSYSDAGSHYHGFSEIGGVYTLFDYPGSAKTFLNDNSASGEAVGLWGEISGATHGLIWVGGAYYNFDYPGSTYTAIEGVNAGGSIVGWYLDAGGVAHGFVGLCATGDAPCTSGHVG